MTNIYDSTPEIEEFIRRSRLKSTAKALRLKIEKAEERGSKAILVPLDTARAALTAITTKQ